MLPRPVYHTYRRLAASPQSYLVHIRRPAPRSRIRRSRLLLPPPRLQPLDNRAPRHRQESAIQQSKIKSRESAPLLLLHTAQIFAAYAAPQPETRQSWIWAWQMSPLMIGILSTVLANVVSAFPVSISRLSRSVGSPGLVRGVPALLSSGDMDIRPRLLILPSPRSSCPSRRCRAPSCRNARRSFWIDELCTFESPSPWIAYHVLDMYSADFIAAGVAFYPLGPLPVVTALVGPGAAFSVLWFGREGKISGRV